MSIPISQFIPSPLSPLGVCTFVLYICVSISALQTSSSVSFFQISDFTLFFFLKEIGVYFFIYLFIFGCVGSSLLRAGFLQLWRAGATLRCSAWASHCGGFSCCGAWALGTRAAVVVAPGLQSAGSVVVAHGLRCSAACGIFLDQGSNWLTILNVANYRALIGNHFIENKLMVTKGEVGEGINWEYGINRCTLPYIKQINNKVLLYSTGNYIRYLVISYNGKEFLKRIQIYTCITKSLCHTPETNTIL